MITVKAKIGVRDFVVANAAALPAGQAAFSFSAAVHWVTLQKLVGKKWVPLLSQAGSKPATQLLAEGSWKLSITPKSNPQIPNVTIDFTVVAAAPPALEQKPTPGTGGVPAPGGPVPEARVRYDGIVVGWREPKPDYPPAEKAALTRKCAPTAHGRWMDGIGAGWDVREMLANAAAHVAAGIVALITYNPPTGGADDWKKATPAAVAATIHAASPAGVFIELGNEFGWGHNGNWQKTPYWPIVFVNGQRSAIKTWEDGIDCTALIADELVKLGRDARKIVAPSMNNPTLADVQAMIAKLKAVDPQAERFGCIAVNVYSDGPNFNPSAWLKALADFCAATGRLLLIPEWGLLNGAVNVANFEKLLKIIRQYADIHYVWVGFAPDAWKSVKLLGGDGAWTEYGQVWRKELGLP